MVATPRVLAQIPSSGLLGRFTHLGWCSRYYCAGGRLHLDMRQAAVAMKKCDFLDELVIGMAESSRQSFSLALGSGRFERQERLEQLVGFQLFARFSDVEADWFDAHLGFGHTHLGARH